MPRAFLQLTKTGQRALTLWALIALVVLMSAMLISIATSSARVSASSTGPSFLEFESGQVRPIAMSPDGTNNRSQSGEGCRRARATNKPAAIPAF